QTWTEEARRLAEPIETKLHEALASQEATAAKISATADELQQRISAMDQSLDLRLWQIDEVEEGVRKRLEQRHDEAGAIVAPIEQQIQRLVTEAQSKVQSLIGPALAQVDEQIARFEQAVAAKQAELDRALAQRMEAMSDVEQQAARAVQPLVEKFR